MKIAVIGAKGIPAKQGGIEHYCQELYRQIALEGHTIDLYARSAYTNTTGFSCYEFQGVKVITLPSFPIGSIDALTNAFLAAIYSSIGKYDIIHFHALGPSFFCWIPRLFSSAKIVVTCHGLDWQRAKWSKIGSSIIRTGERVAVTYADKIIVVAHNIKVYFKQKYGIETIYIPTAPAKYAEFDPSISYISSLGLTKEKYIIFLGRLVPEKCPDLLIKAFQLIDPADWKLALVGEASGTNDFKLNLIANQSDKIIFTNQLAGSKLAEVVRNAGLLVLPSELEGFPLVLLEAMREGIPVLASDIPPHRQLIGQNEARGLMFEVKNLQSLKFKLIKALSELEVLKEKAKKAQEYVNNNYTWKKVSYENLVLYGKLSKLLTKQNKERASTNQTDSFF